MSLKMKRSRKFPIGRYTPVISVSILVLSLISIPAFAQQTNFIASLSGQAMSPTVSTTATHISLKNGNDLAQVFNSYMEINGKSEIPTGEVNGQLSKGVITPSDLSGPLAGKTVTDLTNLMKNDSVYVVVRTQAHENGEIQGVITPSNTGYMQGL